MHGGHGYGDGWWGMGFMWVWWLLVLAGIVVFVVFAVRTSLGALPGRRSDLDTPEQILRRRYAGGEIDREEYQRRLDDLRK